MTIYRLYKNRAFEPEAIAVMTDAYADVCRTLGLSERESDDTKAVARKVIEFAQRGVNDQKRLRDRVLAALNRSGSINAL